MKVLVLGSGIIGVTSAWYLTQDGHEVTVVDRQPVAANETSFANAGLIAPGHAYTWASPRAPAILLKSLFRSDQALRLRLRADPRMWAWCLRFLANCTSAKARRNTARKVRLCLYSQAALHALTEETGIAYDGRQGGLLYLYRDPASLARGVANMQVLQDNGLVLQVLDAAAVARLEPALAPVADKLAGAIHAPTDESGDANLFTCRLAEAAAARGAVFRYRTTVTGLLAERGRVVGVATDQGTLTADAYVVALGCQSPFLVRPLGLRVPVYPVKGYSITVPIADSARAPSIGGVDENNLVAFARLGDRLRLTATAEFAGYDTTHRPADFTAMLQVARELFPAAGRYAEAKYWAGLRPMTPAGTPIIGPTRYPNLFLNTGQGHMGWTMACGSARILTDLLAGRRPEIDVAGLAA